MPTITLIQGSLREHSRTAIVLEEAKKILEEKGVTVDVIDLRTLELQWCDGRDLTDYNKELQEVYERIKNADGHIFGMPVYCYSVSGPLKNFIDIMSPALMQSHVGVICNSGGIRSAMSGSHLMEILAYECRTTTVQPIVHTWAEDFQNGELIGIGAKERLTQMIDELLHALR